MENKYFTPDIEDLCIGYEYEQLINQVWTKEVFAKGSYLPENIDLLNWIHSCVLSKKIRVPYLTKEQIEAEGWEFIKHHAGTEWYDFEKDEYSLYVDFDFRGEIYLKIYSDRYYEEFNYFSGKCKDINTFRKICKLLEI